MQGLWLFCVVTEPWNSGKSTKSLEIHKNTQDTATYLELISAIGAVQLPQTCGFILKRANNIPKPPGVNYVAKNWALAII